MQITKFTKFREGWGGTYCICSKSVKSDCKMTIFSTNVFDLFLTTKRLETDSRFDYLTVLKTTKNPGLYIPVPEPTFDFEF